MNNNRVGVFTTHNEPSTLTDEEKRERARRRSLTRRIEEMRSRQLRFESALEATSDPVKQAALEAQISLASKRVADAKKDLEGLTIGVVN